MTVLAMRPDLMPQQSRALRPRKPLIPVQRMIEMVMKQRTPTPLTPLPQWWHCCKLPDGYISYKSTNQGEAEARVRKWNNRDVAATYCRIPFTG